MLGDGFDNGLSIDNSYKISISFCIINNYENALSITSSEVLISNNILLKNNVGVYIYKSDIDVILNMESNSIILNSECNIILYEDMIFNTICTINLSNNIISLSKLGIDLTAIPYNLNVKGRKNLCFSNKENSRGIENKIGFFTKELKFLDISNNDFRLEDKKFEMIGAPYKIISKWFEFSKKENLISNTSLSVFLNLSLKHLYDEYKSFLKDNLDQKTFKNIDFIKNKDEISKNDTLLIVNALDTKELLDI